jgi:hypothetical protein
VRRTALLCLGAIALALSLAACGGSSDSSSTTTVSPATPTLGTLASDVATAQKTQHSAHYDLDASVDIKTNGSSTNPSLSILGGKPITLKVSGDASSHDFSADGTVSFGGKSFSGKVLAETGALYLNVLGSWYGSTKLGLDSLKKYGTSTSSSLTGTKLKELQQKAGEALSGTITDGPTLDGTDTWEFNGTINADGIAKLSEEQNGKALTAQEKQSLQVIQDAMTLKFDVGKDDNLVRRADLKLDLPADKLKQLNQGSSSSGLNGVESVNASFTLDLSKWGEPVSISPPSSYKPLAGLLGLFTGGGWSPVPGA